MLLTLLALLACSRPVAPPPPGGDLLLITLDTTRADALGVYGGPAGVSPNLDALAQGGLRLDMALAHAPTTLSSHASMFTGLDPHGHGVPRNGLPLEERHTTVAERLQAAGWDTLAVVAASAVDGRSGVQQGFRLLDDDLDREMERRYEDEASRVTDRALALVKRRRPDQRLFLWVHYYDAHSPYDPPPALAARFTRPGFTPLAPMDGDDTHPGFGERVRLAQDSPGEREHWRGLYHGEVAWIDQQLGRLLAGLREAGVLQGGWIVVAGDHGEMFYEDRQRPMGHGPDIDLWVSRVPLILHPIGPPAQGRPPAARVSDTPVGLQDLGPTLLALAGLEPTLGTGRDLSPLLRGEPIPPAPIFLEATKPSSTQPGRGWNNLVAERGVAWDGHLLVRAPLGSPRDGLYVLDPAQPPIEDPDRAALLRELLLEWDEQAPPFREERLLPGVEEALRALGYLEE